MLTTAQEDLQSKSQTTAKHMAAIKMAGAKHKDEIITRFLNEERNVILKKGETSATSQSDTKDAVNLLKAIKDLIAKSGGAS